MSTNAAPAPLLMIPGPIEISDAVIEAGSGAPPSHVSPPILEAMGAAVEAMRHVWCAGPTAQPFVVAGSGTIAMEMAVCNVLEPGDRALVVNTGYFSDRIAEMARRRGVEVVEVGAALGDAPALDAVGAALDDVKPKALLATHVDTSTGVRVDARGLAELARERGALSVFDGVCATAAERFEMAAWGADVYLTASQKAIGLPAGLALLVASERAQAARAAMKAAPPMSIDFAQWEPIMKAYEQRRPSYFSTPATTLVRALAVGLAEILGTSGADGGMERCFDRHQRAADGFRAAWRAMGLDLVPVREELAANTLSAIRFPAGVGPSLVGAIKARGVIVAGGLHPAMKTEYFRVGHMGHVLTRPDELVRTVRAVAGALADVGYAGADADVAVTASGLGGDYEK